MKAFAVLVLSLLLPSGSSPGVLLEGSEPPAAPADAQGSRRARADQARKDRNYKDAYDLYRGLALDPEDDPAYVAGDIEGAVRCLNSLMRKSEQDAFLEAAVEAHAGDWRALRAAAVAWAQLVEHRGRIVAGKFERTRYANLDSQDRDRARALQLLDKAMPLAAKDPDRAAAADVFHRCAQVLLEGREGDAAWRLQSLTDLSSLPDYERNRWDAVRALPAPVDDKGEPVYHRVPASWEAAKTDGERWRWCQVQAMELDAGLIPEIRLAFAGFLESQFGVETLAWWWYAAGGDESAMETGIFAVGTLADTETFAQLASGVKRFAVPDEFNPIAVYRTVAETARGLPAVQALEALAEIHENRRQYPRAVEYLRRALAVETDGDRTKAAIRVPKTGTSGPKGGLRSPRSKEELQDRIDRIVGDWGRFEPMFTRPAGNGATVDFRFRNAKEVEFVACKVDVEKVLADLKTYLKSNPAIGDRSGPNIADLGYNLVTEDGKKYVGAEVARWKLALEPREGHLDRRITVSTPLQAAGAYFLTAKTGSGGTSGIVLWLADTVIVRKPLAGKTWYYVGDARTGEPVPKANLEFFGFKRSADRSPAETKIFAELTDADGQAVVGPDRQTASWPWLIVARADGGRLAYLGFNPFWYPSRDAAEPGGERAYIITDRPVYRPGQTVHRKAWVGVARYDETGSRFAGQEFTVDVMDPKGEKVAETTARADEFGGLEGEYELPADAMLGKWAIAVRRGDREPLGHLAFSVEEYKKPEFEVTVEAPAEPIALGGKTAATVKARYYFGSPVTEAKVRYKVERTEATDRWFPPSRWDWLYGPGFWWFASDTPWYPGWSEWGWGRPRPSWMSWSRLPPEPVAEGEVDIGPDGTVKVEIDSAPAKALHPDCDHRYAVTAEVVDRSRRTIVGTGAVLVARKPFSVTAWVDRGWYRAGDDIGAHAAARTPDGKPASGTARMRLLEISYAGGKPVEKEVHAADARLDADGRARVQFRAARAGQYRLSVQVAGAKGASVEGGCLLTVIGHAAAGDDFRFNAIELTPDRSDYGPGDRVKLRVSTDRAGAPVLLFLRPANGVYEAPKLLRREGKCTVEEIPVAGGDMPNFFVEAVTIGDGKMHAEIREIAVPPARHVLDVAVIPSLSEYRPGQRATVKLKLTDPAGKPFAGSAVVAVYDRSVEYIAGGSNVPEIRKFFWSWRRHHAPHLDDSLARMTENHLPKGAPYMRGVGIFGDREIDERQLAYIDERLRALGGGSGKGRVATRTGNTATVAKVKTEEPPAPGAAAGEPALVEAAVRKEFADTALWVGSLKTGADGVAEVFLDMPENLTTWRIRAWGMGPGTTVGEGQADVVTRKNLIVRLQAPRFFVQKDEVVLSANVHNYLKSEKRARVSLELDGKLLEPMDEPTRAVSIAPDQEVRVDWRVKVTGEGLATVRMAALTDEESDAVEAKFPCKVHGQLVTEAVSGSIPPSAARGRIEVFVPKDRRPRETRLEVRWSPTLAGAMVDALPYLIDFPYGCTEQTLDRFLPAAIAQKTLLRMGLDLQAIRDQRTNLNAGEIGDDRERAKGWKRQPDASPVFDEAEMKRIVQAGVDRLTEMQLTDGGWGWFSGWGERSSAHTTALVVHGLQIAGANDVAIVPEVLARGVAWLQAYQADQVGRIERAATRPEGLPWKPNADDLDALVYRVLTDAGVKDARMGELIYRDRTHLAVYALGLYGLAVAKLGDREKLDMILRNMAQYLQQDDENGTAWLKLPESNRWWLWSGSEYEAQACYLTLLSRADPKGEVPRRLVKYLLDNRKHATYWNSTRDTALIVEAFADFLAASGEDKPRMNVEVWFDGKAVKGVEITPANLFGFDNSFVLEGEAVGDGPHTIDLRKSGTGPLYYNAYLTNFTLEDPIKKAGLEVKLERKYYRLKRDDRVAEDAGSRGQVVGRKEVKYRREPIADPGALASGDLVEIELEIASKNDYEYLVFEDMKPAGFEPVDLRSGYTGNAMGAYVEFRDDRTVFFVRALARGAHGVSYRLRAEVPGKFSALPTKAWAMYAPELKANSDEFKVGVKE